LHLFSAQFLYHSDDGVTDKPQHVAKILFYELSA